jgi:hypothetical protein
MPTTIPPVLSSSVRGPLGVAHLPRVWLKIRLFAAGRLPEGYRHGVGGFDEFMLTTIGVDRDAFIAFVENEKPDYPAVEDYVRAHATNLNDEAITKVNTRIDTFDMSEEFLAERRQRLRLEPGFTKGTRVNDIDDWDAFHHMLLSS